MNDADPETDLQWLMIPLTPLVGATPYALAPERATDLDARVFHGNPCTVEFREGPDHNFGHSSIGMISGRRTRGC
jgi:hypothetical protein